MAQALICDSCEKPITDMNDRAQVILFTDEPIADPQLDLCGDCCKDIWKSTKVKRGQEKAKERIRKSMPEVYTTTPQVEGVDELGLLTDHVDYEELRAAAVATIAEEEERWEQRQAATEENAAE